MRRVEKTDNLVLAALMMCLVCLATYALKIPNPLTQGYVHLGDTFIFMSVLVLGKKNGAIASSIGAAMADIFGGYAIFAIGTFIAKGAMAYVMGMLIEFGAEKYSEHHMHEVGSPTSSNESKASKASKISKISAASKSQKTILSLRPYEIFAMILGGFVEVLVYAIVNSIVYGSVTVGLLSIPGNIGQFACSMVVAALLTHALMKTPASRYFAFGHR